MQSVMCSGYNTLYDQMPKHHPARHGDHDETNGKAAEFAVLVGRYIKVI